ncbi:MAG: putative Ig domain-containing protein, partial [Bacteroidaceae bacterium]|nr:putative Ig domain-containing protein [Bacteroidaceae bacterium]
MASFSTNKSSGVGNNNDKLTIDDARFIYNKKLSSVTINNNPISQADLNALNNAAYSSAVTTTVGSGESAIMTFNNQGTATYTYPQPVCANAIPTVTATAESGLISSLVVTPATFDNPHATITVTHNDGSYYTYTIDFTIVQAPTVTLSSNKNQTVCAGTAINAITVTANNGTATVSNLPSGLSFNQSTGKITGTPIASRTYKVTVSNSACSVEETGTITVNPLPTITLTNNGVITVCEGSQVNVSATGADIYTWSDGLGSDAVARPTTPGTYTVTGTNNTTHCSNTATATVTIHPLPNVTLTPSATTVCTPATISLTAGGADSYSWAGITSSTNPAIVSAAGTYNVTVTGTNTTTGCSNTASQTVTVNQTPTVQITGNNAFCAGDSSTLTVSSTPNGATFVWSDLSTSSTLKVKNAGKYFVTGT